MLCDAMYRPGEILRTTLLGTTATYRVLRDDGDRVLVEVVDAPELRPGFQMRLTADVARALERVIEHEPQHEHEHMLRRFGPASGPIANG
jgi:hypothetical protein